MATGSSRANRPPVRTKFDAASWRCESPRPMSESTCSWLYIPYRAKRSHRSTIEAAPTGPSSSSNSTTVCVTDASVAYDAHTWRMEILVGTSAGLGRLGGDGDIDWLLKGDITIVDGGWAVVDH